MNGRELLGSIYAGEKVTRLPIAGVGGWTEAVERWRAEGLGADEDVNVALGLTGDYYAGMPLNLNMAPAFPIEVLDLADDYATLIDEYGVTKKLLRSDFDRSKGFKGAAGSTSSMALWLDYPVKNLASWKAIYEERFRPTPEGRIPENWDEQKAGHIEHAQTRWTSHFCFPFGGLFSAVRELMGVEGALFAMTDDPQLVHTIVDDLSDFYLESFAMLLPEARLDQITCFEDMCATKAPLMSPAMFREFIAPGYRKYLGGLKDMGVEQLFMDTDGDAWLIIPELIDCGFTGCAPCEVNSHMDAGKLRKAFPDFCLSGGLDKVAVAKGGKVLEDEFERRFRAAWDLGRYTPSLDHGAPPDISWANLQDYARLFLAWAKSPDGPA